MHVTRFRYLLVKNLKASSHPPHNYALLCVCPANEILKKYYKDWPEHFKT